MKTINNINDLHNTITKPDIRALLAKSHAMAKEYDITEEDILKDIAEIRRMRLGSMIFF